MDKLTKRAEKAIEILRAGGCFRKALEPYYQGGEKFRTRIYPAGSTMTRNAVRGIGYQTWLELLSKGIIQERYCAPSSVWPQEWTLDPTWAKYNP